MCQVKSMNQPDGRPPKWVVEMHDHYQRTGYFRSTDLNRLLGDPRESVIVNAPSTEHENAHWRAKDTAVI